MLHLMRRVLRVWVAAAPALFLVPEAGPGSDAFANGSSLVSTGQTGIVEGTVLVGGVGNPPPPMLSPYARRRYAPPTTTSATASVEDVVVFLVSEEQRYPPSDETVVIRQEGQMILPRVTAIQVGTRIAFPNDDDVYHNLFSLSTPHPFNLGRYPPGDSRTETFTTGGVVRMFCDIHSDMVGVILVLDTPHFAKPDASGAYRITGVGPGRYTAVAWHESAPADSVEVNVPASGAIRADFRLGM
jgi:plastocyanin